MPSVEMLHEVDPRRAIMEKVESCLGQIEVMGSNVLCAIYRRPEKTASGLIVPDVVLKEDIYQGKVMLVLKLGPKAFENDELTTFSKDERFKVGDWAVVRASDGWRVTLNTLKKGNVSKENLVELRMMKDISLHMRIQHPDLCY